MNKEYDYHNPIMVNEIKELLNLKKGGIYLDGTLGGGGHSEMILKEICPGGKLIAIDKDDDALNFSRNRLISFGDSFKACKSDYLDSANVLTDLKIEQIDGCLLDLGISSFQIDNKERGFSYMAADSLLDMRMDREQPFSAFDIVNYYSEDKLKYILYNYGEEQFTQRITREILKAREIAPINTTGELVAIIKKAVPIIKGKNMGHPAKKTFQAIRIEVNGELVNLEQSLKNIISKLKVGGRLAVITFHSLEDRIVKNLFRYLELDCICDKSLPICTCKKVKEAKAVTRKPVVATNEEIIENSRAKSAKLRVIEKI